MKKRAEEGLEHMISLLLLYLKELLEAENANAPFLYGKRTAYTECLEWLQEWEQAEDNGLDFEIEKRYPLCGKDCSNC